MTCWRWALMLRDFLMVGAWVLGMLGVFAALVFGGVKVDEALRNDPRLAAFGERCGSVVLYGLWSILALIFSAALYGFIRLRYYGC